LYTPFENSTTRIAIIGRESKSKIEKKVNQKITFVYSKSKSDEKKLHHMALSTTLHTKQTIHGAIII